MARTRTQLQSAREGTITSAMERVAERENRDPAFVRERDARDGAVERDGHLDDGAHASAFFRRGINVRRPVTRPIVARSSPCRRSSPVATVLIISGIL